MREIAASPGIGLAATLEARGHAELEARAATSYEHWVSSEGLSFRGRDDVERVGDVAKFHWEAVVARRRGGGGGPGVRRPRRGRPDSTRLRVHRGVMTTIQANGVAWRNVMMVA